MRKEGDSREIRGNIVIVGVMNMNMYVPSSIVYVLASHTQISPWIPYVTMYLPSSRISRMRMLCVCPLNVATVRFILNYYIILDSLIYIVTYTLNSLLF